MTEDGRTPGVLKKIDTPEKFEIFVEAKELAQEGNIDEARQKRVELGLGEGNGQMGRFGGNGNCNR